jgi:glycerol kinase
MVSQELAERPNPENQPNSDTNMTDSTPAPQATPSNEELLSLLLSMQEKNQKLEQRLEELERSKSIPSSEVIAPKDDDKSEFIGAIDQGTTSSRFLIFNRDGQPVASHQIEFKQIYPNSG